MGMGDREKGDQKMRKGGRSRETAWRIMCNNTG